MSCPSSVCHGCTVAKRCKMGPRLVLITNRNWHTPFQMTYKIIDLGWPLRSVTTSTVGPTWAAAGLFVIFQSIQRWAVYLFYHDSYTLVRCWTHLFDIADEVGSVLPGNGRLTPALDARTALIVDLTTAERSSPRVQLIDVQLGSESFDQHVHSVDHQSRFQLWPSTIHNTQ